MNSIKSSLHSIIHFIKSIKLSQKNHIVAFMVSTIAVTLILAIILVYRIYLHPWDIEEHGNNCIVHIRSGMSLGQISDSLYSHGILQDRDRFYSAAKLSGIARKLKAGTYQFCGKQNNYSVLKRLVRGDILLIKVTVREGIWARDIASILHERIGIDSEAFMQAVKDPSLCHLYGIEASSLEGYLYPDTYYMHEGLRPEEAIDVMVRHFFKMVSDTLVKQAEIMDMSLHEIITLASIIEGEAALPSERPLISALYHNRLKRRMRLQADPTIQYLIPDGPRRLLSRDLEIDSPYNTYLHGGLPPGPVNNPGIACIHAALYPDNAPYLYMVANGDGSHTFSTNMNDHLKAKSRFDRIRRSVRRKNGRL